MNPDSKSPSGGRERRAGADEVDSKVRKTPATDLQPEDVGMPDSGATGRGTASRGSMKQTTNTGSVTISQR